MDNYVSIMVATHKDYEFPQDSGYLPVQVGRATSDKSLSFLGDDTGNNISHLNKNFCELTGLYWLWKNRKANTYGLVHYRRYFRSNSNSVKVAGKNVCSSTELATFLNENQIVLSKPRNYWIESIRKHYKNAHHINDLDILEDIIRTHYPEYLPAFDKVMNRRTVSLYNMFVMNSEPFNNYCEWLFTVLFDAQKRIQYLEYGPYQGRVFGFLAERLLNVWVEHNIPADQIKFLPVVNLEGENLLQKAIGLLERKFKGVKQS